MDGEEAAPSVEGVVSSQAEMEALEEKQEEVVKELETAETPKEMDDALTEGVEAIEKTEEVESEWQKQVTASLTELTAVTQELKATVSQLLTPPQSEPKPEPEPTPPSVEVESPAVETAPEPEPVKSRKRRWI